MNTPSETDWNRLLRMTDEEATANAFSDPDNQLLNDQAGLRHIHVSGQNGTTLLERFWKALEKEKKISLTVRYDDVVHGK